MLERIHGPGDLADLSEPELVELADEIRSFLVHTVATSRAGGHLGPNLGVVELTMAIHRVFESPRDRIVFDTGHQSYVHKLLTGRRDGFEHLREQDGLSGYPAKAESPHDWIENSHASTSISYADGMGKANRLQGRDEHVVAVIGDGALTGGMAWEALNNLAADPDNRVVVVVNDNGRSYSPTVGGLAQHLTDLRTDPRYEQALSLIKRRMQSTKLVGPPLFDAMHAVKKGLKDAVAPQGLFEDLGLKYVGPVDGHDLPALEKALHQAQKFDGPVIVHAITQKGRGYAPAEAHDEDNFHAVGNFDPETGQVVAKSGTSWTKVMSNELVRIGERRDDVVAITAAMLHPTGLAAFAERFPDRCFDVGIAEQHATTSAAGLAMAGLHPVVAVYSTFLNRAFDQVLMDVALHRCGVTFVLDRAGATGDDGASHNGMWDMSILQVVPGLRLAAPRDGRRVEELLDEAVSVHDAPTVVRIPKGAVSDDMEAVDRVGGVDVLRRSGDHDVLLVGVGPMVAVAMRTAELLAEQGVGVTVVDPRWVLPVAPGLLELAARHSLVVTAEDSGRVGGVGARLVQEMTDAGIRTPVVVRGLLQQFWDQAKRDVLLERSGLTPEALVADALRALGRDAPALTVGL